MTLYDQQIDVLSRFLSEPVDAGILAQFEQGIAEYAGMRGSCGARSGFPLFAATTWRGFVRRWRRCMASLQENGRLTYLPESRGPYTSTADTEAVKQALVEINKMRTHLLAK